MNAVTELQALRDEAARLKEKLAENLKAQREAAILIYSAETSWQKGDVVEFEQYENTKVRGVIVDFVFLSAESSTVNCPIVQVFKGDGTLGKELMYLYSFFEAKTIERGYPLL